MSGQRMSLLLLSSAFSKYLILELKQRPMLFSDTVSDIDTFIQYVEFLQNTPNQHRQQASQKQTFHSHQKRLLNAHSFVAISGREESQVHIYDEYDVSEIPVLYCCNESVNARLKGSAVFSHHSQQLFLCLSWAQDISDQQKWEQRASRPFFSFVRVALLADASYCHNWIYWKITPWTEETTQCRMERRKDRKCWLKEQWTETKRATEWKLKISIPPLHVIPASVL